MTPIFVSFYTPDYAEDAAELESSLLQFGLTPDIDAYEGRGDWLKNCAFKSEFIRDKLLEHEGRPVVWIDADGVVLQRPSLFFEIDCDFAAHWLRDEELISATMYWGNTPKSWELAQEWVEECRRHPQRWDQRTLNGALQRVHGVKVERLPPTYNWISEDGEPDISERIYGPMEPTILQTQASRRLKR